MSDKKGNVRIYKDLGTPENPGMYHGILCMTGQDKGTSYILTGNRVVMGRGKDVDVVVMDSISSREHLELVKMQDGYVLTDLRSHNGTIVNDLRVTQHRLADGDKIIIGQTVYKYSFFSVDDKINELQEMDEEEDDEDEVKEDEEKNSSKQKKKRLIIAGVIILFVMMLLMPDDKKKGNKRFKTTRWGIVSGQGDVTNILNEKRKVENEELEEKISILIHKGLRELREKNFYRAIYQFELALIMNPQHYRASFYLNKTRKELEKEIELLFKKGQRDWHSLKYMQAAQAYCAIMRLIDKHRDDDNYKKAKTNLKTVTESMGLEENEIKCH
ncbi:MAG: FHA domain-containing protein [Bacteriovoracaceae bacterium]|nr:FHA domain-containing protein [Bacteriovoracaceae bacterium]